LDHQVDAVNTDCYCYFKFSFFWFYFNNWILILKVHHFISKKKTLPVEVVQLVSLVCFAQRMRLLYSTYQKSRISFPNKDATTDTLQVEYWYLLKRGVNSLFTTIFVEIIIRKLILTQYDFAFNQLYHTIPFRKLNFIAQIQWRDIDQRFLVCNVSPIHIS
jgi:hypothetical protein